MNSFANLPATCVRRLFNLSIQQFPVALLAIWMILFCCSNIFAAPGDLDTTFGAGKAFTAMSSSTDYTQAVAVQSDGKIVSVGALFNGNGSQYDTAIARHNADGTLDSTFAGDGTTYYAVNGSNHDYANAVAIDSNGKIVITGQYISGAGNWNTFVMRYNSDGTTDNTFGVNGLVTTDVSGGARNNLARAVSLQTDGKIVVAGYTNNPSTGNNFSVVRYTTSGIVDFIRAFDVSLIAGVDEAYAVAVQTDGKIIAGGYAYTASGGSGYDFALLRLNADGTVDGSYSSGVVHTDFNSVSDYIYSIALQSDGKLVAAGIGGDASRGNFGLARYNTNGTLDTSFGTSGKVTTNFTNNHSGALGVKIQTDGKIVAAGYNENGSHSDFAAARYNANGTLDTTFDTDGKVVTKISSFDNYANSVALQTDGKIVAAGFGTNTTNQDFALVRYNTNGALDTTFVPSGKVTTAIGSGDDVGHGAALQSDGKIVVSGRYYVNSTVGWYCTLVRYNADGTLDTSFGTGGKVTQNYANNNFEENYKDVAIQTDGKIVVTGYYYDGTSFNFITARFNTNGTLDTTFNGGGFVAKDFGSASGDYANAVAVQSDGRIVVAGESGNGSQRNSVFVSYNPNGSLNTTFGSGGSLIVPVSNVDSDSIYKIVIQPDHKIVAVGYASPIYGGNSYFSAVRLTEFGVLDNSFDGDGILTTQIGAGHSVANSVVLQSDDKIVAAGYTQNGASYNLALTRYNADGSLDTSFDTDGKVTTTVGGVSSYGYAVKIQADNKIVAAGQTAGAGNANDFLLARYNPNGSLDTNFSGDGLVISDLGGFSDAANAMTIQADGKIIAVGQSNNGANNDIAIARYLTAADCTYSISPASANVSASSSTGSITVTPNESYCSWTAASNAAWLTVTSGASGTGAGTVNYSVAANSGAARTGTMTVAGQTFTVSQAQVPVSVSLPVGIQSLKNQTVTLPITVTDTTNRGIISFDFTVAYDASVLTPAMAVYDQTGTLASSFTITPNTGTSGQVRVSGYHTAAMSGAGTMLFLKFTATGNPQTCSSLNFTQFIFNGGNPAATTSNGQVCIVNGSVAGTAFYGNNIEGASVVKNVTMSATGTSSFSTTTATDGTYLLEGFSNGNYTVTPSKTGDINDAISSMDASQIARYAVGLDTLTANQILAGDVSNEGSLNSYDAALISQYLVNISNPGITGTWRFTPTSRSYSNLITNQTGEDYSAILLGDVTGNWTPTPQFTEFATREIDANAVTVSLPNGYGSQNQIITVPVTVGDTTGRGILAYDFELTFNQAVLQLDSVEPVNKTGTVSSQLSVTANPNLPSTLKISAFGIQPLEGSGTLLNLRFRVVGQVGETSPLTWQRFKFNENQQLSTTQDGQLRILAPTAASVNVGGRVTTADGSGIVGARVTLTDANGNSQTATTNKLGAYRFRNIAAGAMYTISVSARRFTFNQPTQIRTVTEETTNVDFIADQNSGL